MLIDFDIKSKIKELKRSGQKLPEAYFDIGVAFWLLDPDGQNYPIDNTKSKTDLYEFTSAKLKEFGLEKVFYEIEMPLLVVLADMEERGILVDKKILENAAKDLEAELGALTDQVHKLAGRAFNLNSPKQLGEILFDVLNIKPRKKTKTGGRSTSAETLESMLTEHEIVPLILKHRELFKLQSTYVLPLEEFARVSKDHRVRTTYLQTGTATGRLSSENPNLQNIPTGAGYPEKIRSAFVARKGCSLLSLDYSQIELRVLASVAGDAKMIGAFHKDLDIHKMTASQVFNVPLEAVTKEMRGYAKTLNFGVIYGMGPRAFAAATGKSFEEAESFIEEYFNDFADVRVWHEHLLNKARQLGYVENENGRKRWLPNIISPNERLANEAVRAAMNMPIQGLAADIIKLAMIAVHKEIPEAELLLSVHDELVFEVPDDMLKEHSLKIKNIMEAVYELKVPLKVDIASGKSWAEIG